MGSPKGKGGLGSSPLKSPGSQAIFLLEEISSGRNEHLYAACVGKCLYAGTTLLCFQSKAKGIQLPGSLAGSSLEAQVPSTELDFA